MTWLGMLVGCTPDAGLVHMSGVVHDAPDAQGDLVEGVALTTTGTDLVETGTATTDAGGAFDITVPAGQPFYLALRADGFVATHFSGTAGRADFTAGNGYPWLVTPEWEDEVRALHSACPSAQDAGAIVAGDVRLYVDGVDNLQSLPPVPTAVVNVYTKDGEVAYAACYHDDEGNSVAEATEAGNDGAFAVFGVPAGEIAVEVIHVDGDGNRPSSLYAFDVDEDGFVPGYPLLAYEGTL